MTPLRPTDRAFLEKCRTLSADPARSLLAAPGFDAAPALDALCRHAGAEHPDAWSWDGRRAVAHRLGWAVEADRPQPLADALPDVGRCLAGLPAGWRLAGLLSLACAEDFAIVDADSGRIPWLAVCLPSHWSPEAKVGRPFTEIHAPVADNAMLLAASAHLLRLVTAAERWERFVWTITPRSTLRAHPDEPSGEVWPDDGPAEALAARAFWRTERQTFIPLPDRRQAVFTIHVDVAPLDQAIADAAQAARVRDALASMSPSVLAYRGLVPARDRLLAWLDARAAP